MDIKGFALQSHLVYGSCANEEKAIISYCILKRIPYKLCNRLGDRPEGYIPSGRVDWCEKFLPSEKTIPDYYPDFLKDHLYRKVWKSTLWPQNRGVFIKPADRHKRFNGFITVGGYRKKKRGPYWCSDIVTFINEWRYYIADGKILTGEWYSGDELNTPDAPELDIDIPKGYCGAVDFGLLDSGEMALVEANSPYACGWYGKQDDLYVEWLVKGWDFLIS
jgi:hypothetical protein